MSSHHIVREDQEPALLILSAITFTKIEPLLEWSPLVIITSTVLEEAISWGIKIDVVLAPEAQRAEVVDRIQHQAPVTILSHEDQHQLRDALYFLIARKHNAVHIAGALSVTLRKELTAFADRIQITFLEDNVHWLLIQNGFFKKWFPQGATLKIIRIHPEQEINIQGILPKDERGMVDREGFVTMQSAGTFWVGECME